MTKLEINDAESDMLSFINKKQVQASFLYIRRGIEREFVRTTSTGSLSQQPHPKLFGSALTHPSTTTDFAAAQMELVDSSLRKQTTMEQQQAVSFKTFVERQDHLQCDSKQQFQLQKMAG